ncbi:LuxR C-terminal-related transcriptional regulator [Actinosynnema sp. NPDC059797]
MLLERRQQEHITHQQRLLEGWDRLTALLPQDVGGGSPGELDGVVPLANFQEVVTRAAELYPSAKRRLRGTETGEFPTRPTKDRVRVPPKSTTARFQMIYQAGYLATAAGSRIVETSARHGEEVRLRREVPLKMLHVDDSVALVSADRSAQTALLVRTPAIVSMLGEWFDLLWSDSATIDPTAAGPALSEVQRKILGLMTMEGDAAIARRLRLSTTTVRRHIKAIYTALGVNSRFAAGVAAAKRGWV